MKYISTDQLEQFDLRDHYWELGSWNGQDLAIWVSGPAILAGAYAGKQIAKALVTFRGVRMEETFTFEGETKYAMTTDEAMAMFAEGDLFVFSYYPDPNGCEFCGLGEEKPLAVIFDFDSVTVEWDEEYSIGNGPVGELIRK